MSKNTDMVKDKEGVGEKGGAQEKKGAQDNQNCIVEQVILKSIQFLLALDSMLEQTVTLQHDK